MKTNMQRVLVIGSSGAGKSIFSRRLSALISLPLTHLDRIWHKPDKTNVTREEFDRRLREILAGDVWIIDGNYSRTLSMRLAVCDTVFLLDYPLDVCLEGARSRVGHWHDDLLWLEESFDPEFESEIRAFPQKVLPEVYRLLALVQESCQVVIFHSREESENFLKELEIGSHTL